MAWAIASVSEAQEVQVVKRLADPGYPAPSPKGWVDIDGDGKPDYCRFGGEKPRGAGNVLLCQLTMRIELTTPATLGTSFIDNGYDDARQLVQVGKTAYFCRLVGNNNAHPSPCCSQISLDNRDPKAATKLILLKTCTESGENG
ncbi:MAG TPA: hypothetical protein VLV54_03135 [Thermoanaerobaculia bacterium]|nr:hypothetical protein [Thermoanaerobaculia bacterium]